MKNATFYLLDNDNTIDGLSAVEQLVCEIAAERWRSGKRVLIACEDEAQAIRLDEALWARPPESFVPHNLSGEGPRGGATADLRIDWRDFVGEPSQFRRDHALGG